MNAQPPKTAWICSACPDYVARARDAAAAGLEVQEGLCGACATRVLNEMINAQVQIPGLAPANRRQCFEVQPEPIFRIRASGQTITFTDPGIQ
jgi:hypothetical protein